jgi:type II secretory pathway pseudopilin PulG
MSPHTRSHEAGFTLAEALIATVLTLITLGAALGALTDSVRLGDRTRRVADTNHGLQAAMALMVRDFMQAGSGIPNGGIPLPSGQSALPVLRPSAPGSVLPFPAGWTAVPAVAPGAALGPTVQGRATDLITVLYVDVNLNLSQWPLESLADDGSSMSVNPLTPITGAGGLAVGDLILFSNANGNALQTITRIDPEGNEQRVYFEQGDPMHLNQPAAETGSITSLRSGAEYPPTTAKRILMLSYYIDTATDPSWPRLVRQVNFGLQPAIALGVENLQFSFDLVDGGTNPANVKTPDANHSANQIRKVNIFLASRSQDVDHETQTYFRNSMATQVSLRSLSFMDRYK